MANEQDQQTTVQSILAKRPPWANALIVAIESVDQSDIQSDYHGHKDVRAVAIGWRKGKREDFKQLRKAAATFPPTAHLGPGRDVWTARVVFASDVRDGASMYYEGHYSPFHRKHPVGETFLSAEEAAPYISSPPDPPAIMFGENKATFRWELRKESIEHREHYSMGHGNYLSRGGVNITGWRVESIELRSAVGEGARLVLGEGMRLTWTPAGLEDGLPGCTQVAAKACPAANDLAAFADGNMAGETRRDMIAHVADCANCRDVIGSIHGIQREDAFEQSRRIVQQSGREARSGNPIASKLLVAASRLQRDIDKPKPYAGMNPTRKRIQAWEQHTKEVARAEQLQAALRTLAEWHETGEWPTWHGLVESRLTIPGATQNTPVKLEQPYLDPTEGQRPVVTECTRDLFAAAVQYLQRLQTADHVRAALAPWNLDAPDRNRSVARWLLLHAVAPDKDKERRRNIEALERKIMQQKIPGYFPTPAAVVARMLEAAELRPGMRVLEPSAGGGAIADAIKAAVPDVMLQCVELNHDLCDLLKLKGHPYVGSTDFLELGVSPGLRFGADWPGFDRILMNPPFERGQDIEHVMHAYELLAPGGRLVALMSPGGWQRNDSKARAFRDWLADIISAPRDGVPGEAPRTEIQWTHWNLPAWAFSGPRGVLHGRSWAGWEALPDGSFKESGTGVSVRMLVIDKPAALPNDPPTDNGELTDEYGRVNSQHVPQTVNCPARLGSLYCPPPAGHDSAHQPALLPDFGGLEELW